MTLKKLFKSILTCAAGVLALSASAYAMPDLQTMLGPHFISDDNFSMVQTYENSPIISGWDADVSGGTIQASQTEEWFRIQDTSKVANVSLQKKLRRTENCIVTAETSLKMGSSSKNTYFRLSGDYGEKDIFRLSLSGGKICIATVDGTKEIRKFSQGVFYGIKVKMDLSAQTYDFWLDGSYVGSFAFPSDTHAIDFAEFATGEKERADLYVNGLKIHTGFALNEQFFAHTDGSVGEDWSVHQGSGTTAEVQLVRASSWPDYYSAHLKDASSVEYAGIKREFTPLDKRAGLEYKFAVRDDNQEFDVKWLGGEKSVFEISSRKNALYLGGEKVYDYVKNVWYTISIDADFETKRAKLYLNNRLIADDISFGGNKVDGFEIATGITKHAELWADDIVAYSVTEPETYVPVPQKRTTDGYLVGAQTCDMWRDGQHLGWDYSLTQPERIPLIGMFDDGSRTAADWDIKHMVENGIDYRATCWFVSRNYSGDEGPLKMGSNAYGLLEGYMRAEYSDMMKYTIIFENAACQKLDAEAFKKYIVPYWIEYFIKDPRFLVVDNKPVIYLYIADYFYKYQCGSDYDTARECLDYLREECKKIGFDGCTIIASRSSQSEMYAADIGCDGIYNYSFNASEMVSGAQIANIKAAKEKNNTIFVQPTISMGNEASAWLRAKGAIASVDTFRENLEFAKNEYFENYDNWTLSQRLVMLGTWNEYNEGHYIAPCGREGFGYLDAVRQTFTGVEEVEHALPTEEEKRDYCILFPENRAAGLRGDEVTVPVREDVARRWAGDDLKGWTVGKQIENFVNDQGYLGGTCVDMDPSVMSEENLEQNIDGITYIKIRINQLVTRKELSVFFITNDDTKWNEAKGVTLTSENAKDGFYDVYVPVWMRPGWKGTLKQLRIDPLNTTGDFMIESVELLRGEPMDIIRTKLDGELLPLVPETTSSATAAKPIPVTIDGKVYMTMSCYERYFGIKMVHIPGLETFKAATSKAMLEISTVDGTARIDGNAVGTIPLQMYNGQYVFPVRELMTLLGYEVDWDGENCIVLVTSPAPEEKAANADPEGTFNFNEDEDMQGWTSNSHISSASVSDGILYITSKSTDPQLNLRNISLDASKYTTLKLRIKNMTTSNLCELFFTTDKDSTLNAAKSFKITIDRSTDDFVEYEVDLKNSAWTGNITSLRLDPMTAAGDMEIDYIILCE